MKLDKCRCGIFFFFIPPFWKGAPRELPSPAWISEERKSATWDAPEDQEQGWGRRARTAHPLALRSPPRSCLGLTVTEDPTERTCPRGGPLSRQWHLFAASLSAQTDPLKNSYKWGFSTRTEIALSAQWNSCGGHTFQCRSWPHQTFHSGGFYRGTALPRDVLPLHVPTNTPSFPFSLTIKAYGVKMGGWQEFLKHISTFFIAHTPFSLRSWGWEPGFSLSPAGVLLFWLLWGVKLNGLMWLLNPLAPEIIFYSLKPWVLCSSACPHSSAPSPPPGTFSPFSFKRGAVFLDYKEIYEAYLTWLRSRDISKNIHIRLNVHLEFFRRKTQRTSKRRVTKQMGLTWCLGPPS